MDINTLFIEIKLLGNKIIHFMKNIAKNESKSELQKLLIRFENHNNNMYVN